MVSAENHPDQVRAVARAVVMGIAQKGRVGGYQGMVLFGATDPRHCHSAILPIIHWFDPRRQLR
jgi:hypothetical protein